MHFNASCCGEINIACILQYYYVTERNIIFTLSLTTDIKEWCININKQNK